jgi:hypothetical protein
VIDVEEEPATKKKVDQFAMTVLKKWGLYWMLQKKTHASALWMDLL